MLYKYQSKTMQAGKNSLTKAADEFLNLHNSIIIHSSAKILQNYRIFLIIKFFGVKYNGLMNDGKSIRKLYIPKFA